MPGPALALALALALLVAAATPGLAQQVIINKLDDLDHGIWPGTGNLVRTSRHCVARTAPGNLFSITILGDGPGGAFEARNGAATLVYDVRYRDRSGVPFVPVLAGVPLTNLVGRNNPNNCRGQRQRVRIRFRAADMAAALAGTYTGVLTLIVAPM